MLLPDPNYFIRIRTTVKQVVLIVHYRIPGPILLTRIVHNDVMYN